MQKILFITGNEQKAKEYKAILGDMIEIQEIDLVEIQESSPEKIVEQKAKEAFRILNKPLIVEDVSLVFTAFGLLPGPYIKWFLRAIGPEGLIRILKDYSDKSAKAIATIGFYDGTLFSSFEGVVDGSIASDKKGGSGFGWDSIFIPNGFEKTYAQMNIEEKSAISHRKKAILQLQSFLEKNN